MRQEILVILVLLCIIQDHEVLTAQWRGPQLIHLGPEEGLPSNVVSMVQDSTGYLYYATGAGLYRYDGNHFEFFGHDPMDSTSIGGGELNELCVGSDGLIWITTRMGGLNSFNPKTRKFIRYPVPELPFRSIPTVHGIFEDSDSTLWVGASHFRLMEFDRKQEKFITYTPVWIDTQKHGGRLVILTVHQDPVIPQRLWLSVLDYAGPGALEGSYGLVAFDKKTHTFESTSCFGYNKYEDPHGKFWGVFWGNLITSFDPRTMTCDTFHYPLTGDEDYTRSISRDIEYYDNQFLVSTPNKLWRFNDNHSFDRVNLSDKKDLEYSTLFIDRDQNLWIGTNQGAFVWDPDIQHIRFFSLVSLGINFRIFPGRLAHYPVDDAIYFSQSQTGRYKGFFRIPLNENAKEEASFIETPFQIEGIACDANQKLWAAGDGKIHLINPVNQQIQQTQLISNTDKPLPWILKIETNRDGWVCMIGADEFIWFHLDAKQIRRIEINQLPGSTYAKSYDNKFDGFTLQSGDKAYLYSNEVHVIDLNIGKGTVLKYDPIVNPNVQRIQHVAEDRDGYIWMSTFIHTGKYRLEGDSLMLLESFSASQGVVGPNPVELHIDSMGRVWGFNSSGMNAIDPKTHEVRFFGTHEGLPHSFMDPRQVITITGGRIATISHTGIIVFNPDDLWNSSTPKNEHIIIKRIRIDGREMNDGVSVEHITQLELKPGNTGVHIEFQALSFPTDYKMEYSYRIREMQEDWISIGRNQLVTLPSLAPGNYTFEIKAGSPLSQASVKVLQILVHKPLFQKWWFILLVLGMAMTLLFLLIRYRIHRIRQQETERTEINKQMAELELKALRSQMNPHFMFNSLNSIKNYILHAEPKLAAEYLSNFAHLIRMILQNSREKVITLQEELETLILYIELEQIRFDNQFEFNCMVEDDVSLEQIMIPPMLLQPYIENAIWHGLMHKKEKGHLSLRFSTEDKMVACAIEDDGVGRAKAAKMKSLSANKYKSMGMGIIRDRIEIMNKMDALGISTEIIDKYDSKGMPTGTVVIVRIPGISPE